MEGCEPWNLDDFAAVCCGILQRNLTEFTIENWGPFRTCELLGKLCWCFPCYEYTMLAFALADWLTRVLTGSGSLFWWMLFRWMLFQQPSNH